MAETGRLDPFENVISLVAGPISAAIRSFEQLRKGTDEVLRGMENFNATMENLNETTMRINRLLNEFEEPIRAMLPQLTRTIKLADELSTRLAAPVDQVAPGLSRLAETLNSPIFSTLPRDLGQFMEIINDLGRRMSPLSQLAEQASGMFGLRLPGFPGRSTPSSTLTASETSPSAAPVPAAASTARSAAASLSPVKTSAARRSTSTKRAAKQPAAKSSAGGRTKTGAAAKKRAASRT